jgi:hypothetical protein
MMSMTPGAAIDTYTSRVTTGPAVRPKRELDLGVCQITPSFDVSSIRYWRRSWTDQFGRRYAYDLGEFIDHVCLVGKSEFMGGVRPGCSASSGRHHPFDASYSGKLLGTHAEHRVEIAQQLTVADINSGGELADPKLRSPYAAGGSLRRSAASTPRARPSLSTTSMPAA